MDAARWREVSRRACQRALRHARATWGTEAPVVESVTLRFVLEDMTWHVRFRFWADAAVVGIGRYLLEVLERVPGGSNDVLAASQFEERIDATGVVGRIMGEVIAEDRARRRQREVREAVTACTQELTQDNVSRLFTAWTGFPNPPDDHVSNRAVFAIDPGRPGGDHTAVATFHGHEISMIAVDEMERWPQQLREAICQEAARRYDDALTAAMTADLVAPPIARSFLYGGGRGGGRQDAADALAFAFAPRAPVPYSEALVRGEALLRSELTKKQAKSLDQHGYFDVQGGKTGRHYRIAKGNVQNVFEITMFGRIKRGLCFAPAGDLVWGDVMLAQKTALELFEDEALAVANEFM
jgi:hypothetical protein